MVGVYSPSVLTKFNRAGKEESMELKIRREQEQKKGFLGGNKGIEFKLRCKVELTPEENALVEKAKVGDYVLTTYTLFEDRKGDYETELTVNDLVHGMTSTVTDVQKLLGLEEEVKNGCQNLKSLLQVISSFGGEEVIEI